MAYILEGEELVHYPDEPEGSPTMGEEQYSKFMHELAGALHIGRGATNSHEVALFMEWAEYQISTEQAIERSGTKNTRDFCERAMDLVQRLENIGSSYTLPKAWAIHGRVVEALQAEEIPPPSFQGNPDEVSIRDAVMAQPMTAETPEGIVVPKFTKIHTGRWQSKVPNISNPPKMVAKEDITEQPVEEPTGYIHVVGGLSPLGEPNKNEDYFPELEETVKGVTGFHKLRGDIIFGQRSDGAMEREWGTWIKMA